MKNRINSTGRSVRKQSETKKYTKEKRKVEEERVRRDKRRGMADGNAVK